MCNFYNKRSILKIFLSGIFLMIFINPADAQMKIGANGAIISPASLLELESANQGLLLPRLSDTVAINGLTPPNGMLIYLTKAPAVGLYVRKVNGWEYITGSLAGNGNFNSLTVANAVTAGSFSGPLNGNASSATLAATATNSLNSAVTNDITTQQTVFPTFATTSPGNSALRTSNPNLSYVPSSGILTAKGFAGPLTGNVTGTASAAIDATNSSNARITTIPNNSATPMYPTFVSGITGALPLNVSDSRLSFIPSTGELTAPLFRGALAGNASSATTVSGNVAAVNGGTGQSTYTPGDLLYATTSVDLSRLSALGQGGKVLRVSPLTGLPIWDVTGAGSVTSVSGTTNRIVIENNDPTVAPQVNIAPTYAGQNTITTVGALSSGSLASGFNPVNPAQGGTGLATLPVNVLVGNGTAAVTVPGGTNTAGTVLTSMGPGVAPQWTAPAGTGDMHLGIAETVTAAKTFNDGTLILKGSGGTATTTLKADANANGTITFPAGNITLVNADGAPQTISSNKTFTGTNSFSGSTSLGVTSVSNLTITSQINGQTASTIINGASDAANASDVTNGTIVRRTASGNFTAGTITANLAGTANNANLATLATTATTAISSNITATNANSSFLVPFVAANSGSQILQVSNAGLPLSFNPSTALLQANISGNAATVTTIPTLTGGVLSNTGNSVAFAASTGSGAVALANNPDFISPSMTSIAAPSNIVLTTNAGTGSSGIILTGSNLGGNITLTQDGSVGASGAIVTVSYSTAFPTGSFPVLSPANAATAALGTQGVFATGTNNDFTISAGPTSIPPGTYSWNYVIVGVGN